VTGFGVVVAGFFAVEFVVLEGTGCFVGAEFVVLAGTATAFGVAVVLFAVFVAGEVVFGLGAAGCVVPC
jgi:hypothetical protein